MDLNYYDTFITVSEDCPTNAGVEPQARGGKPTVALVQWGLLHDHPYEYT